MGEAPLFFFVGDFVLGATQKFFFALFSFFPSNAFFCYQFPLTDIRILLYIYICIHMSISIFIWMYEKRKVFELFFFFLIVYPFDLPTKVKRIQSFFFLRWRKSEGCVSGGDGVCIVMALPSMVRW